MRLLHPATTLFYLCLLVADPSRAEISTFCDSSSGTCFSISLIQSGLAQKAVQSRVIKQVGTGNRFISSKGGPSYSLDSAERSWKTGRARRDGRAVRSGGLAGRAQARPSSRSRSRSRSGVESQKLAESPTSKRVTRRNGGLASGPDEAFIRISTGPQPNLEWVGLGLGESMLKSNLFVVYPDGNGGLTVSVRRTDRYGPPSVVSDVRITTLGGSGIRSDDGRWEASFKCSGCIPTSIIPTLSFGDGGPKNPSMAAVHASRQLSPGDSVGSQSPDAPIKMHDSVGKFTFDLSNAWSDGKNPFVTAPIKRAGQTRPCRVRPGSGQGNKKSVGQAGRVSGPGEPWETLDTEMARKKQQLEQGSSGGGKSSSGPVGSVTYGDPSAGANPKQPPAAHVGHVDFGIPDRPWETTGADTTNTRSGHGPDSTGHDRLVSRPVEMIRRDDGSGNFSYNYDFGPGGGYSLDSNLPYCDTLSATGEPVQDRASMEAGVRYWTRLRAAHGSVSAIAFVGIFPLAAILLRVADFHTVVQVHAGLQAVGWVLMIAGGGMGIHLARNLSLTNHAHPFFGIVAILLIIPMPIFGIVHQHHYKRVFDRTVVSHFHLWFGRLGIIIGIIAGGLGIGLANDVGLPVRSSNGTIWNATGKDKSRLYVKGGSGVDTRAVIAYAVIAGLVGAVYLGITIWNEWDQIQRRKGTGRARARLTGGY